MNSVLPSDLVGLFVCLAKGLKKKKTTTMGLSYGISGWTGEVLPWLAHNDSPDSHCVLLFEMYILVIN